MKGFLNLGLVKHGIGGTNDRTGELVAMTREHVALGDML
jgi:hypothetical protein